MSTSNNHVKFEDERHDFDPDEANYQRFNRNNDYSNENDDTQINYSNNQNYAINDSNRSADYVFYDQDPNNPNNQQEYETGESNDEMPPPPKEKIEYHFQTKIRNSGFWGKVKLRNGTWLIIIGLILFCISIVFIGVFWGFWYSHKLNYPMRILAITLLSLGISFFIFGLISNYIMLLDPNKKKILGSPFRKSTYVMFASIFLLVIASDLITLYYTYWHNRWVNTPLIILAIIFYFFGGIGFLVSLYHICKRVNNPDYVKVKKDPVKKEPIESETENEDDLKNSVNQLNSDIYSENSAQNKKDFRKKMLKLKPRPVIATGPNSEYETNTSRLEQNYDQV